MKLHEDESLAEERWERLNEVIDEAYLLLAPDEVDLLAADYEESVSQMIEITEIRENDCTAEDYFEGESFRPVIFPTAVHTLLTHGDVFLATLGRRGSEWHVIHLNPPYLNMDVGLEETNEEFEA